MNFKQFIINETSAELKAPKSIKELKKILDRDCAPFMKEMGNDWLDLHLHRGLLSPKVFDKFIKLPVRKDRRPLGTTLKFHNMFNDIFEEEHGVDNIRSESVFTSGDFKVAKEYGPLWVIFPIGDYTYWWSNEVLDLYITIEIAKEDGEDIPGLIEGLTYSYTNTDLKKAIKSGNEIMILCDNYYAISEEYFEELKEKDE